MHSCVLLKESHEYEVAVELKTILKLLYRVEMNRNNGDFYSLKLAFLQWQVQLSGSGTPKHAAAPSYQDAAVTKYYL